MRNLITISLILLICAACAESPEAKFERDGISLTSPTGWKITDEQNFDNEGYYLSIEKDGLNASGLMTISWVNGEIDLKEWIKTYQDELKNNIVYKNTNLLFGPPIGNKFNTLNTTSVSYTVSILGLKNEGIIHFFYKAGKTFAVLKQESVEDKSKNITGFELIEQSLIIK